MGGREGRGWERRNRGGELLKHNDARKLLKTVEKLVTSVNRVLVLFITIIGTCGFNYATYAINLAVETAERHKTRKLPIHELLTHTKGLCHGLQLQ